MSDTFGGKADVTETPHFYRKKPVVITAMRVPEPDDLQSWGALAGWLMAHDMSQFEIAGPDDGYGINGVAIQTLEGTMKANIGDWIIKGVKGEFYPCKPDIFAATYEPVDVTGENRDVTE